jgi:hypothetical protein
MKKAPLIKKSNVPPEVAAYWTAKFKHQVKVNRAEDAAKILAEAHARNVENGLASR